MRAVLDSMPTWESRAGDGTAWYVVVPAPEEHRLRIVESILTVSDGFIGTRGSLEEDGPSALPGTFAAGAYEDREGTSQALMTLPSWVDVDLAHGIPPGERCLDLRSGVLWRVVRADGHVVLRSARWASLAQPGTEVLVLEAVPEVLDPTVLGPSLVHVERTSALGSAIRGTVDTGWERMGTEANGEGNRILVCRVASFATGSTTLLDSVASGPGEDPRRTADRVGPVPRTGPRAGPRAGSRAESRAESRAGARALLTEQAGEWAKRWSAADVEVVGDPELTLAARYALFQLASAAPERGEAAVGARGLTGPAYAGHVFWDADVFVLPALAAARPGAARAMLEYRIRRLDAARRAAAASGRRGARFPWESGLDGTEVAPDHGFDERGTVVPIRTGQLEEHITADVAWAAWHFAAVTGSWAFLDGPGRPLVLDTARYWASRVRLDDEGRGHLDGVIGPDEYHEDVDDNAFTNGMAAWNLRRAAELVRRRPPSRQTRPADDCEVLEEAELWDELADSMITGYVPALGRHRQFAGFDELEPLVAADLGSVPLPADIVLGRERLMRSQIIKQADVVMLHHLLPDGVPEGSMAADLDFYVPRTSHGSSLSPSIHASVLARAGRTNEAANLLDLGRRVDFDDLTGTTGLGLHLAAMGGLWQAIVFGFAGIRPLRPDDVALAVDPRLPQHWQELRVRLTWHGVRVRLRCRNDSVHVACSAPLSVVTEDGRTHAVDSPGRWIDIDRQGGMS